jgi:hypothetical protein
MKSGNLNFLEPSGPPQACNGTALPFTRWGNWVNATPRLLYRSEGDSVSIVQQTAWVPVPVWTGVKILVLTGIRSPDRPSCRNSPYNYVIGGRYKKKINSSKPSCYYSYMYHQVQHSEFLPSANGGYLHILYGSQNTQRLFPGVTWTDWILLCGQYVYISVGFRLIFFFAGPCHIWEDGCRPVTSEARIRS